MPFQLAREGQPSWPKSALHFNSAALSHWWRPSCATLPWRKPKKPICAEACRAGWSGWVVTWFNLPHPSSSHWYFSLSSQNTSQIENFHGSVTTAKHQHNGWCRTLGRATVSTSQNQPLTADHIYIWLVIAPHVSDRCCYNGGLAPCSHSEGLKRPQHPSAVNTLMGIPLLLIRSVKQESAQVGVKPRRTEGMFSRMRLQAMSTVRVILSLTQWCCPRLAERATQFSPKGTSIKNNKCCPKPLMKWS